MLPLIWYDLLYGSFMEKLIALLLLLSMGSALLLGMGLLIGMADVIGQQGVPAQGFVTAKHHEESQTTYVMVDKILVPVFFPEEWRLTVQTGQEQLSCEVSRSFFEVVPLGQPVEVEVAHGRLSGTATCQGIRKAQ